jgi:hypothetical protein
MNKLIYLKMRLNPGNQERPVNGKADLPSIPQIQKSRPAGVPGVEATAPLVVFPG